MNNRVIVRIPLEHEILTTLLPNGPLDSIQHMLEHAKVGRIVDIILAALEHTRAHQTRLPPIHIPTNDIRLRVITHHVDVIRQTLLAVNLLHPLSHHLIRIHIRRPLGLTVQHTLQVLPAQRLILRLNRQPERAQMQPRDLMLRRRHQIPLREVNGDMLLAPLRTRQQPTLIRHEQVVDDLQVRGGVVRLSEDEDGVEVELREVARLGARAVFFCEAPAGRDGGVPGDDVLGVDDVLEAVLLGDVADLVALAAADEDGLVVLGQGLHGGVRLDELVGGDGLFEDLGELLAAEFFGFAAAVGEEDVGELDAFPVSRVRIQVYITGDIPSSLSPFKIRRTSLPSSIASLPYTNTPSISNANAIFFTAFTLACDSSCTLAASICRPKVGFAAVVRETRGERGIGSDVLNELRELRRSFMDGSRLKWCMKALASLMELPLAGTSMTLSASRGMEGRPFLSRCLFSVILNVQDKSRGIGLSIDSSIDSIDRKREKWHRFQLISNPCPSSLPPSPQFPKQ